MNLSRGSLSGVWKFGKMLTLVDIHLLDLDLDIHILDLA